MRQDLGQILRLCLTGPLEPKSVAPGLAALFAYAADVPDFVTLEAHVADTQARVRRCFERIVGEVGDR